MRIALTHSFTAIVLLGASATTPVAAQTLLTGQDQGRPVVEAMRAIGPIHLDGRLDEPSWAEVQPVDQFTQVDPEEGRPVSEPTVARIVYDDEALYIGVRMDDSQSPTIRLGRRDMDLQDSDWITVVIDSYHDHRTAFSLGLNPAGVQRDAVKSMGSGGTESDDLSWNTVWEGRTTVDSTGWTAEYRIPFGQLRFRDAAKQVWGIQIERIIGRRKEFAVLSFTPKSEPGGIPTYANLVGLRDVKPGHRLEVLPYALARSAHVDPGANPFRGRDQTTGSAGLDLLYRVTSELTLNATFNPDFGQVEADPAVVNLSTYETFFEEKRPFFVEGGEIFDFGRNTSGGRLFYSRRIGRSPQLSPPTSAADTPDVTTILGAAKFSGKTASGWSLGMIEAVTAREDARIMTPTGTPSDFTVEPLSNYLVARVRKDGDQGRTSVGGMLTAVNRQLSSDPLEATLRSSAYAAGTDFRMESPGRAWALVGSAAYSRVAGDPAAMVAVQTSGNHFFQRPDATHLDVDTNATSLTGYSVGASLTRQGGNHWRGNLALAATSPAFEVNDLGYQNRTDRRDIATSVTYQENQPGSILRNYALNGSVRYEHNYDWQRVQGRYGLQLNYRTLGFWDGSIAINHMVRAVSDRNTRGGPLMRRPADWQARFSMGSDSRKPVSVSTSISGLRDEYDGWNAGLDVTANIRTSPWWNIQIGPSFSKGLIPAQYVGTVSDASATATFGRLYLFAPLRQTTLAVETRSNITFTPKLSFELYAQPFLSSGDYLEVGSLDEPRGYTFTSYAGQVPNKDFNLRSLRGTAVLRWEYRPGSTLYFAWQQNRADYAAGIGDFDFERDRQALFRARADNVFVIKASYWLTL